MDPITTAIIAALSAGVAKSAGKLGEKVIVEAYEALKAAIRNKLGIDSDAAKAVNALEAKPESDDRKGTLSEELTAAKADQDSDILAAAQSLLDKLKAQPGGEQIIQQATGSYIAQASQGSTASVSVNQPPKE